MGFLLSRSSTWHRSYYFPIMLAYTVAHNAEDPIRLASTSTQGANLQWHLLSVCTLSHRGTSIFPVLYLPSCRSIFPGKPRALI
jgi:hypothetical protein